MKNFMIISSKTKGSDMWTIKEDIATYKSDDFSMIAKIKLIRECGMTNVRTETIYMDDLTDDNLQLSARAMRELGEYIDENGGVDAFLKYSYRTCKYCGELFQLKNLKREFCSQKCRTAAHRLANDVEDGELLSEVEYIFKHGRIVIDPEWNGYDVVEWKDSKAKIFYYDESDEDAYEEEELFNDLRERDDAWIFACWLGDGTEYCVVFDKEGSATNEQIKLIYDTFLDFVEI